MTPLPDIFQHGPVEQYLAGLDDAARSRLSGQLQALDPALLRRLFADPLQTADLRDAALRARPPAAVRLDGRGAPCTREEARQRGLATLSAGEVAVVLVAGGQATRLGFDHPKGMFPIGPVSGSTLFEILCHKVLAAARRAGGRIPLYLMTSPATHEATIAFFTDHARFGLAEDDVWFCCQGTMPAVDAQTGELLLAAPDELALSPDGHGGLLAALARAGAFADLQSRGIRRIFYLQVDNPLAPLCDPMLLGYHLASGSEMTTQVVAKSQPLDKVGNVVEIDGRMQIIEYSDLPAEAAERRNPDGSLALWAGNIAVHVWELGFLQRMAQSAQSLPFHVARKVVPYVDSRGQVVTPASPNAIKYERFIFDLLPLAERPLVVEVDEQQAFAPLKNAAGAPRDTEQHVQAAMLRLHGQWLADCGAMLGRDTEVEIDPLFAQDADELRRRGLAGLQIGGRQYLGPLPTRGAAGGPEA